MDLFIFQGKRKCNIIIRARSRVLKILRVRHGGALIEQFGVRVTQELHGSLLDNGIPLLSRQVSSREISTRARSPMRDDAVPREMLASLPIKSRRDPPTDLHRRSRNTRAPENPPGSAHSGRSTERDYAYLLREREKRKKKERSSENDPRNRAWRRTLIIFR